MPSREGLARAAAQLAALGMYGRHRSKYGSRKESVDGIVFDSAKEARIYRELKLRLAAREIAGLKLQTAWPLHVVHLYWHGAPMRTTTVGVYRSDFDYLDLNTGEYKVIDVKSVATRKKETYRLKKKMVEAIHGITIDEV